MNFRSIIVQDRKTAKHRNRIAEEQSRFRRIAPSGKVPGTQGRQTVFRSLITGAANA
jgi:hypothetical protein